uniref:NADH-ubiquinone oxidoreductase chain 3 n=1 Tax=Zygeupolia rubens TaxID=166045 RepID=I1SR62_9BILA|nr:NADH dehydrogenase subunit 3 [Zygeupolia rubens]ADZ05382.1 NADH dehydrogenase subunit 3 [Zygeupolia rubens]
MLVFFVSVFIGAVVSIGVAVAAWFLAKRSISDREKSSPFECGFDPKLSARVPFSVRFFLLAVIFLIFDIEIALLLPYPFVCINGYGVVGVFGVGGFLIILCVGLIHEWREGSLDWVQS